MFPPVYTTLRANATVLATVADRIGPHGTVAQTERRPYITWQIVLGQPHDNLSDPPPSDFTSLQINCYHADSKAVVTLASAVRDALDAAWVVNRTILNVQDFETKLYNVGLEADFITQRA